MFRRRSIAPFFVALAGLLLATTATAGPKTMQIEGLLHATGGGAAADGVYDLTAAIYDGKDAKTALWSEGPIKIGVTGGRFAHTLGALKPLSSAAIGGAKEPWISFTIGTDPELPRRPLHAVAHALTAQVAETLACSGCVSGKSIGSGAVGPSNVSFAYAGAANGVKGGAAKLANDLQCTGCVGVAELKFDADVNLGGKTLTAAKVTSGSDVIAKGTIAAKEFIGDGSKLTGIKTPAGECSKKGEVVKGINPDGSLKCIAALDLSALPADGIDEISNGLLNNQFVDTLPGKAPIDVLDNSPKATVSVLDFPNIGSAQKFEVKVHVTNSDITHVTMFLLPPDAPKLPANVADIIKGYPAKPRLNPKFKNYVLHAAGGKKGDKIDTVYPTKTKLVEGDLSEWIGKNPKGQWRLVVVDHAFFNNAKDGKIESWSITIQTLSNQKIGLAGNLIAKGSLQVGNSKVPCNATTAGTVRWTGSYFEACNGYDYFRLKLFVSPGSKDKPAGASCKSIKLTAGDAESGLYWVRPNPKKAAFQAYCDMDRHGGGWTLVMNLDTNDGGHRHYFDTAWWTGKTTAGSIATPLKSDFKHSAYTDYAAGEVMIAAHREGAIEGTAFYQFTTAYNGKTMQSMMATLSDKTVTGNRVGASGSIGNAGRLRNAGDAFIDHNHPLVFNSRYQPKDATNYTRIGTNYASTCGTINCNGHNFGGIGGRHARGGWGVYYEAAQLNGYCNTQGVYGTNHSKYSSNDAGDQCGYVSRDMDFAIYLR